MYHLCRGVLDSKPTSQAYSQSSTNLRSSKRSLLEANYLAMRMEYDALEDPPFPTYLDVAKSLVQCLRRGTWVIYPSRRKCDLRDHKQVCLDAWARWLDSGLDYQQGTAMRGHSLSMHVITARLGPGSDIKKLLYQSIRQARTGCANSKRELDGAGQFCSSPFV